MSRPALLIPVLPVEEYLACDKHFFVHTPFESITTEFALYCQQGHLKQLAQAVTLFASSLISSVLMALQDCLGSRRVMVGCFWCMAVPGMICVAWVDGLVAKVVGMICLWVYVDVTLALTSVYFNELLVAPFRNVSNVLVRIMSMVGGGFGNLMTFYLQDYRQITWLFFWGYVVFTLVLLFLPSSPSFLLKQKKTAELTQAITKIACINHVTEEPLQVALAQLEGVVHSSSFA